MGNWRHFHGEKPVSQTETVSRGTDRLRGLDFRLWRRQFARDDTVLEADPVMRAVAEGLIPGRAAAAKTDRRATSQPKRLALRVHDLKVSFHADGAVVVYRNLRRGQ